LEKHAFALQRRKAGEPRAHFRRGEIEIGLLDVDAVDAGDDGIVGGGRAKPMKAAMSSEADQVFTEQSSSSARLQLLPKRAGERVGFVPRGAF